MFKQVMQHRKRIWEMKNHSCPQKNLKTSLNSTSFLKFALPGILLIESAIWRLQKYDKTQTKQIVRIVGMIPDRANVAGRSSMAGLQKSRTNVRRTKCQDRRTTYPVSALTAIEMDPSIPIDPGKRR